MDISREFAIVLMIIAGIVVWLLAKVVYFARKSERQWREVDKSKLQEWDDDAWK